MVYSTFGRLTSAIAWLFFTSFCVSAQVTEAETGKLSGTHLASERNGYTGTGYVTGFDVDGDRIEVMLTTQEGFFDIYLRYASPHGEKWNFVFLNGENLGSVPFPLSSSFTETRVGKVHLPKGSHTLAIVKDWGWIDLDNIRLEPVLPSDIYNLATNLVTPEPSVQADSLYQLLSDVYGKVILAGQYGADREFNHIADVSGRTPVLRGFDMMDYSPSRTERGATSTETERAIGWSQQRGIVTFAWHWNAPKDLIDQPGKEWWRGFYTEATTFDVSKAMNDTTSEEYSLLIRDIDAIAGQLKKLATARVPVLWRPLHEAEGGWFWWGAKGAEPCKWLWRLLFNRLVHHHSINNLLWVWTSTTSPHAEKWYPGDDWVDIVGADIYLPAGSYGSNFVVFDNLVTLYGGEKIIALSENGPIPDPDRLFEERAAWNWFSTWSGDFITDGVTSSESHVRKVFNHEYVITLDEIDDLDTIIAGLEEKRNDKVVTGVEEERGVLVRNPLVHQKLELQYRGGPAALAVLDLQGRIVWRGSIKGTGSAEVDMTGLSPGTYLLRILAAGKISQYRIVKL